MNGLSITDAFAHFGATRTNSRWAYSAIAADGALVIGCWHRYLKPMANEALRYEVKDFARWSKNPQGKSLLQAHLKQAYSKRLPVRMVMAVTDSVETEIAGVDGSELSKTFIVRDELVGHVVEFDSGRFIIDFHPLR
jgi:hypothetical protein